MNRIRISHLIILWAAAVLVLTAAAALYSVKPGEAAEATTGWPGDSALNFTEDRPNIVLFIHPRCPCTRASLLSLAEVLQNAGGPVKVHLVAYQPKVADSAWQETPTLQLAEEALRQPLYFDTGGLEIDRFSARTSGEVFAYAPNGRLLFHGGITSSRGHEGPSRGSELLQQRLEDVALPFVEFKTFGCALVDATPQ